MINASNNPKAVLSVSAVTIGTGATEAYTAVASTAETFSSISFWAGLFGIVAGATLSIVMGYTRWHQHKSYMRQGELKEKLLRMELAERKERNGAKTRRDDP